MRHGFQIWNFGSYGDLRAVAELAAIAEAAGWDGFFTTDHLVPMGDGLGPARDPFVQMALIATATERIRIGPMVACLPRREPGILAQQVCTLDHLSGGRLILGVGAGGVDFAESTAFGGSDDARIRADVLDEMLEILHQWWSGDSVEFEGAQLRGHLEVADPSLQRPRIPVWVAATWPNRRPFRRAARWDGVFPMVPGYAVGQMPTPDETASMVAYLGDQRTSDAPFDVVANMLPIIGIDRTVVRAHADAGATWLVQTAAPFETLETVRGYLETGPPTD